MRTAMEWLAERLSRIPSVVAVTLGGSRAQGTHRPDSDWDFGLYYEHAIDPDDVRALGYEGTVVAPGDWAYPMNGGAWLRIDGQDVDLLYRDRADVERWTTEADDGRWELFRMPGYLCGMASYVLVGEASVGRVLAGTLDQPGFPPRLGRDGPQKWMSEARFWLQNAAAHANAGDIAACVGKCSSAIVAVAQARLLERSEWALNEKGIVVRAGLADVEALLLRRTDLRGLVAEVGRALDLP
jgi:hypothetical protein